MKIIFTAHSSALSHYSTLICKHVFKSGNIPINLFNLYGYFMHGLVDREDIFEANNKILGKCDKLWVFGKVCEGVQIEIDIAKRKGMSIRFFELKASNDGEIVKIAEVTAMVGEPAKALRKNG